MKVTWDAAALLAPVPAVMVSCGSMEKPNIITIAWTGIVNTDPAMTYISVRPSRYSYDIIKQNREFVINLVSRDLVRKADGCGIYTGHKVDKFKKFDLTPQKASKVNAPMIAQSPINIECTVKDIIPLGTHDMFLAQIVAVNVEESLLDQKGKLCMGKAKLVAYSHGDYLELGKRVGKFGFSVKKKRT